MFDLFSVGNRQAISAMVYWCDEEKPDGVAWVTRATLAAVPSVDDLIMVSSEDCSRERLCVVSVVIHGEVLRVGVNEVGALDLAKFGGISRAVQMQAEASGDGDDRHDED